MTNVYNRIRRKSVDILSALDDHTINSHEYHDVLVTGGKRLRRKSEEFLESCNKQIGIMQEVLEKDVVRPAVSTLRRKSVEMLDFIGQQIQDSRVTNDNICQASKECDSPRQMTTLEKQSDKAEGKTRSFETPTMQREAWMTERPISREMVNSNKQKNGNDTTTPKTIRKASRTNVLDQKTRQQGENREYTSSITKSRQMGGASHTCTRKGIPHKQRTTSLTYMELPKFESVRRISCHEAPYTGNATATADTAPPTAKPVIYVSRANIRNPIVMPHYARGQGSNHVIDTLERLCDDIPGRLAELHVADRAPVERLLNRVQNYVIRKITGGQNPDGTSRSSKNGNNHVTDTGNDGGYASTVSAGDLEDSPGPRSPDFPLTITHTKRNQRTDKRSKSCEIPVFCFNT